MTNEFSHPSITSPEHQLRKLIIRMRHCPEGVCALHESRKQEQVLEFLEQGLITESIRVVRVNIQEVLAEFQQGHMFGNFFLSKTRMPDWQENTAFLFCIPEDLTREQAISLVQQLDTFCGRNSFTEGVIQKYKIYPIFLLTEKSRKDIRAVVTAGLIREPTICDFTEL